MGENRVLEGRRIVVGVSGGIAAYKVCALVSRLVQDGAQVRVNDDASGAEGVVGRYLPLADAAGRWQWISGRTYTRRRAYCLRSLRN